MALDNIAKAGQVPRGIYQRVLPENPSKDYYYILRETGNVEPILVEYGFIDNNKDAIKLQNNITDYVEGVVKAIADYTGVPYIPPTTTDTGVYTVQRGDTLYSIARKYNLTVDEIKALNNLTSNEIYIGQNLQISPVQGNTYVVQRGDTLYSIARKYDVSVNDLKEVNNLNTNILYIGQELLIPSAPAEDIQDEVNGAYQTYIVKSGDSIWSISREHGITPQELIEINSVQGTVLQIGQNLLVPIKETSVYTVERGDSLWSIAKKFNTTVNEIKSLNNITDNLLTIGQQIIIP